MGHRQDRCLPPPRRSSGARPALAALLALTAFAAPAESQQRRPFYVIAHRCNDIASVNSALRRGANAIECDIRHNAYLNRFVVNHDHAHFWWRDDLVTYLRRLRSQALRFPALSLVMFDCKIDNPDLALPLLNLIRGELTNRVSNLRVLISVARWNSRWFFAPIMNILRSNEGLAIDEDNHPARVSGFFTRRGARNHAYGNGTAAPGIAIDTARSIMDAVAQQAQSGRIGLVYVWTLASRSSMRDFLRVGVDGIMVNDVPALRGVVRESEFRSRVRLATRADNPFVARPVPAMVLTVRTGWVSGAGTDAHLRFTVRGAHGSASSLIDAFPPGLFERRDTNYVTLRGVDVGTPSLMWIWNDGSGNRPSWFVDRVTVQRIGTPGTQRFEFDTWIGARRSAMRHAAAATYRLVVHTSDRGSAGTDARVHFVLRGTGGILIQDVSGAGSRFERDRTDVITLRGRDIGTIRELSVSHDESGWGDDWHLDTVFAQRVDGPGSRLFRFNAWVDGRHPVTRR